MGSTSDIKPKPGSDRAGDMAMEYMDNDPLKDPLPLDGFVVPQNVSPVTEGDISILKTSKDSEKILDIALRIAAGKSDKNDDILLGLLGSSDFLNRLDSTENYQGVYSQLRLAKILKVLMNQSSPAADKILVGLISSTEFQSHILRIQLLIRALSKISPVLPSVIEYWDRLSSANSPLCYDVIEALYFNQSEQAFALLDKKYGDPAQPETAKISWMRLFVLPRRNSRMVLMHCQHLLTHILDKSLQPYLVEVLFSYQPQKWYRSPLPPKPPSDSFLGENEKEQLKQIGKYALKKVSLDSELKKQVKHRLGEL